jgi:single-strand DNA-binding protein
MNTFQIVGNLAKKPEVKELASGQKIAHLQVVVDEYYKDKEGALQNRSSLFFVDAFTNAENHAKYLEKGDQIVVTGKLRSWYDEESKRGGVSLIAQNVVYPSRKAKEGAQPTTDDQEEAPPKKRGK